LHSPQFTQCSGRARSERNLHEQVGEQQHERLAHLWPNNRIGKVRAIDDAVNLHQPQKCLTSTARDVFLLEKNTRWQCHCDSSTRFAPLRCFPHKWQVWTKVGILVCGSDRFVRAPRDDGSAQPVELLSQRTFLGFEAGPRRVAENKVELTIKTPTDMFTEAAGDRTFFRVNALATKVEEHLVAQLVELEFLWRHRFRIKFNGGQVKTKRAEFDR